MFSSLSLAKIFSRSLPIGGSSMTAAIAREFESPLRPQNFARNATALWVWEARTPSRPNRTSCPCLETCAKHHDPTARGVDALVSHYRAQQQGNAPDANFSLRRRCGICPICASFFRRNSSCRSSFLIRFETWLLPNLRRRRPDRALRASAWRIGWLGAANVTTCPMELSLLPAGVVRRQEFERRRPFFVVAAACVILTSLAGRCITREPPR